MSRFTISVYHFFKRHKAIFYLALILPAILFAHFGSKIKLEEDITKLLPATQDGGAAELVFSNLKVKDKVFILFNPRSDTVEVDNLIEVCDEFISAIEEKDTTYNVISNTLYQLDEDLFLDGISFLYENAPTFIRDSQYPQIDSLLNREQVEKQMAENYSELRSAAGSAFVGMITQDPIGIRNIFLSEAGNISGGIGGGSFTIYGNHIFTADTSIVMAFITPNFSSLDSKQGIRLTDMLEDEIAVFQKSHPEVEILFHGAPIQSVFNSRQIKKDIIVTVSISLLLICFILIICFKNKSALIYLILPVIYGVIFSLTVMYLIKGSMSLMALGIGAIVMGVAFSYCMHVITHFKYVNDPIVVLKDQTVPVILGCLTTIGAFMGLLLTKSELLQDFGLFATLGLVGTTFFCLIFLPHFFNPKRNKKSEKAFAILEKINSFPLEKQKWLIVLILVVSTVCYVTSGKVKFDSNLQNIGYHEEKVVHSRELLESKTSNNKFTIYFAAASSDLDSALIYNRQLTKKLDQLVEGGKIYGYSNPATLFIPTEQREERIDRWYEFWTDSKKQDIRKKVVEAGNEYKFAPNTFAPFFNMLDAEYEPVSLYDAELLPPEILDNIIEYTDNRYLVFTPVQMERLDLIEVGDEITAENPSFIVIDPMYYTNEMVKVIHDDFSITLTVSSLFVLLVLLASYKSITLALLAFLPMGLSWYIVLGCMATFGLQFNLINIVISTFIFGIGVDYSIFIMDGLLSNYRGRGALIVYHKTAIFFSAVILLIVIISLLFAVHPAIASIGISTLIGMGGTILIAYSLQPFLFRLLITSRTDKGKALITISWLLAFKKRRKPMQLLRSNYAYKGSSVTSLLSEELLRTKCYRLISRKVVREESLLDFGCRFGFCSYRAAIANKHLNIVGFDTKQTNITLANSCYQKTSLTLFTTDESVLNSRYDVIILNKDFFSSAKTVDEATIQHIIMQAKIVIVRKSLEDIYRKFLQNTGLSQTESDGIYTVYTK
ncbi:MAG: MMPL family transporter [Prevotellaceae bacterium]|jgi:predicted RND superfamily exporter protein|nr:MMPL family transporter [Prevotellaceae bacterium]